MQQALFIAKTGLEAQQNRLGVISNNLANVNTSGFKRDRVVFEDLIYQNLRQVGANSSQDTLLPSGTQLGTGVRTVATEKLFTQGGMIQTNNNLDLAIQGRGFFQVLMPNGDLTYTRDGTFQINSSGELVTASGYPVQPTITIPNNATSVTVGVDGVVTAVAGGDPTPQTLGTVLLADFINPAGLQQVGQNLFKESPSSGAAQTGSPGSTGFGSLAQGTLETSNVNVVEELVSMIEAQRAYEMNSKAIETADSMLQFVNQTL